MVDPDRDDGLDVEGETITVVVRADVVVVVELERYRDQRRHRVGELFGEVAGVLRRCLHRPESHASQHRELVSRGFHGVYQIGELQGRSVTVAGN